MSRRIFFGTPATVASVVASVVATALALAACSGGSGPQAAASTPASTTPAPSQLSTPRSTPTAEGTPSASAPAPAPTPTRTAARADVVIRAVPDSQWAAIVAAGAWHPGCPASQSRLRRVEVNFHGFDGAAHRGVLVVNADVATEVAAIFTALFDQGFAIHRMQPIEVYHGDDNASMAADNTSAYNCRRASQANAPPTASPHANGRAVDLNPYENPWVDDRCHCFQPDAFYGSHRVGKGVISKGGPTWTVFTQAGWTWQDNSSIDYQHFDTGYPSVPRTPR